ncbi:MAG: hypothetical protein AB7L09_00215 [Nitrospira sp.]
MGYLDDKLPQRRDQIVECPALYKLVLRVRHRDPFQALIAAETEDTIGKIIRSVVPDPEDWQFGAGRLPAVPKGFTEFRFWNSSHRSRAREELRFSGYYTELIDE